MNIPSRPDIAALVSTLPTYVCPRCSRPLGRYHAYPVTDPGTLLSMLTTHAPLHWACAEQEAALHILRHLRPDEPDAPLPLAVVLSVKAGPTSPSGRLVRLTPEDPDSIRLHLFQPDRILFRPYGCDRAATNEEVEAWMAESIAVAASHAPPGSDEHQEIVQQIARLQRFLPRRLTATDALLEPSPAYPDVPEEAGRPPWPCHLDQSSRQWIPDVPKPV